MYQHAPGRLCFCMTEDEKANRIIKRMMAGGAVAGGVPVPALVPFMGVVAGGVVAIGSCYGVQLTKGDAWKLIREFFRAAGFTFTAGMVGGHFTTWIISATGLGLPVALALDAAQCTLIAYAVGTAAKHYFKGATSRAELRTVMRDALAEARANLAAQRR